MNEKTEALDARSLADQVQQAHGAQAFDYAVNTAKQHLHTAAWKSGALWLQVVNRLNASKT
tara:strand:- start:4448 stop:4630 length:183 start_codon:yes stop_codon:yes gene_type:complete